MDDVPAEKHVLSVQVSRGGVAVSAVQVPLLPVPERGRDTDDKGISVKVVPNGVVELPRVEAEGREVVASSRGVRPLTRVGGPEPKRGPLRGDPVSHPCGLAFVLAGASED